MKEQEVKVHVPEMPQVNIRESYIWLLLGAFGRTGIKKLMIEIVAP